VSICWQVNHMTNNRLALSIDAYQTFPIAQSRGRIWLLTNWNHGKMVFGFEIITFPNHCIRHLARPGVNLTTLSLADRCYDQHNILIFNWRRYSNRKGVNSFMCCGKQVYSTAYKHVKFYIISDTTCIKTMKMQKIYIHQNSLNNTA